MTRWLPWLIPVALLIAFLLGQAFPGLPEEPLGVSRGAATPGGLTLRPGESTGAAVRFLRTLRSDPPPVGPPVVVEVVAPPPPPPPPPDVAVVFKQALTGIARDPATGAYAALVRDPAAPGPQITAMKIGDRFGDGWRVREISAQSVTLAKGREVRVVGLFG